MKKLILLSAIFFCTFHAGAQDEEDPQSAPGSKFFGGGNFGLSLGSYTLINLSPQIGYRFNPHFASGIGLNLQYISLKQRDYYGNDFRKATQGVAGLNVFARFYPVQKFLIQLQPEGNYIFGKETYYQPSRQTYKLDAEIVPSLLAGGGFVMPTAKGAFLTTVMYDLLQKPDSPYGNRPIINVGYNFNF